jgi:predicted transcriptional regulator
MKKNIISSLFLLILLSQNSFSQFTDQGSKCFEKCSKAALYQTVTVEYYLYTGNAKKENVNVERQKILVKEASSKWQTIKPRGCFSKDCEMTCLVEIPAKYKEQLILLDTTQSKNFIKKTYSTKELITTAVESVEMEVLCKDKIDKNVILKLSKILSSQGYKVGNKMDTYSTELKKAIALFQKKNNLYTGALTMETLEALGINEL